MLTILLMLGTALSGSSIEEVQKKKGPLDGIRQFYVRCSREVIKIDSFLDFSDHIIAIKKIKTVIFVNSKGKVALLAKRLKEEKGVIVTEINREMGKTERERKMMNFLANRNEKVLISTNVVNLDLRQVSLVINFDLPAKIEDYGKRIRRLPMSRVVINLVTRWDYSQLGKLVDFYDTTIEQLPSDFDDLLT